MHRVVPVQCRVVNISACTVQGIVNICLYSTGSEYLDLPVYSTG